MTRKEKQIIRGKVERQYAYVDGRDVRIHKDGAVSVYVDEMPNTNQAGRIFSGWDTEILRAAGN